MNSFIVIMIGDRYFRRIQNGRVQTAWTIIGGEQYFDSQDFGLDKKIRDDMAALTKKGKKYRVVRVKYTEEEVKE